MITFVRKHSLKDICSPERAVVAKIEYFNKVIFQLSCATAKMFHQEGLFLYWILWSPVVVIHKAELIKEVINHPATQAKAAEYEAAKYLWGNGIIMSDGEVWRKHRRIATPAFSKEALKNYIPVFNKRAVEIIREFRPLTKEPWVDVSSLFASCVLNIASDTMMGMQLDGKERVKDVESFQDALNEHARTAAILVLKPWLKWSIFQKFSPTLERFFLSAGKLDEINEKIMEEKLGQFSSGQENFESISSSDSFTNSLMDKLIAYHMKDPSFTRKDIKDDVNTFLTAGYDTTAITLKWLLYFVGLHPQIQERLFWELESIFGQDTERMPDINDLNSMKYMECAIKETLRLCPPFPFIGRKLQEDVQIGKYTIPKNASVIINFYMLHRDPELYHNPEVFCPERFQSENKANLHPCGFLPFSGGARNCIGQKFAMLEMKIIFFHVIRNFQVTSLVPRDKINLSFESVLKNLEPLQLRLTPR